MGYICGTALMAMPVPTLSNESNVQCKDEINQIKLFHIREAEKLLDLNMLK